MDIDVLYAKVWNLLVSAVRSKAEETNQSEVARTLGVAPVTVSRWLSGDRGSQRLSLREAITLIHKLGVDVEEIVRLIAPEKVDLVAVLLGLEKDTLSRLASIFDSGGPEAEKLKAEIDFLSKTLKK